MVMLAVSFRLNRQLLAGSLVIVMLKLIVVVFQYELFFGWLTVIVGAVVSTVTVRVAVELTFPALSWT